jgi:undecaprenyl diphosphate synthase
VTAQTLREKTCFFSEKEIKNLDPARIPHHIAIMPDGNRRWAKKRLKDVKEGYTTGAETLLDIVRSAKEMGVKMLTVYGFSTENWSRPKIEVDILMEIYEKYLLDYQNELLQSSVRFHTIGDISKLPASLMKAIEQTKQMTGHCTEFDLILAFNYGSRDEICRATRKMMLDCVKNKIQPQDITEDIFSSYLDTARFPDPDLLIRTSGEKRMSNFLIWQCSYAEIYPEETNWPSFTPHHLLQAVLDFQTRSRRYGGGSSQEEGRSS